MNVLNRHFYFGDLVAAYNSTGNSIYTKYFDALVKDWVLHLPCNIATESMVTAVEGSSQSSLNVGNAAAAGTNTSECVPLGSKEAYRYPVCKWDSGLGGKCLTGTTESPWRSLEMGIRMCESVWPSAFFAMQQAEEFTTDARVLMLLAVAEHTKALVVDGGGWK